MIQQSKVYVNQSKPLQYYFSRYPYNIFICQIHVFELSAEHQHQVIDPQYRADGNAQLHTGIPDILFSAFNPLVLPDKHTDKGGKLLLRIPHNLPGFTDDLHLTRILCIYNFYPFCLPVAGTGIQPHGRRQFKGRREKLSVL